MNRAEQYVVDCAVDYVASLTDYEVASDEERMLRNAVRDLAQYRRNLKDKRKRKAKRKREAKK